MSYRIRTVPEARELGLAGLPHDLALSRSASEAMTRFAKAGRLRGPCRLNRFEKALTLMYFRELDLSVLDKEGDCL